jgi:hypothetical protein
MQKETKFTKGQWIAKKSKSTTRTEIWVDGDISPTFEIIHNETNSRESEANANLIAAAPFMLEALFEAQRCLKERIRIDYSISGADEATAERMAQSDIRNFLLFDAIDKAVFGVFEDEEVCCQGKGCVSDDIYQDGLCERCYSKQFIYK